MSDRARVQLTLLRPRDGADVLGQPVQTLGAAVEGLERRCIQRTHAVLQRLEVGLDRRQRGAHLMREVGEDSPTGALDVTEPFGEVVDRGRELVELRAEARAGHSRAELSVGDLGRGLGDLGGGTLDPACEVPGHHERHEDRDQQRDAKGEDQSRAECLLDVGRFGRGVSDTGLDKVLVEDPRCDDRGHQP